MLVHRSPAFRASTTTLSAMLAVAALLGLLLTQGAGVSSPARLTSATTNPVTPGNFRGYGFDQCTAPSQSAMDAWMQRSPFLAVGIYISGNSRACRSQPNLTPAWVSSQLASGWKLLPITLGPQASCNSRYPRYSKSVDPRISPKPGSDGRYDDARSQGQAEAAKTVDAAAALGISSGSTLWYDIEAFDVSRTACRESALSFLSAYTRALHRRGYVSGVYSSAGSGIAMLDQVRMNRPSAYTLPDAIWLARWDGKADTSTTYISEKGWNPGRRVKQYQGGHDETWGGVRINIDRDYLSLGRGAYAAAEVRCGGIKTTFTSWPDLDRGADNPVGRVMFLQCLLRARHYYSGKVNGRYTSATVTALNKWKAARGFPPAVKGHLGQLTWIAFLAAGSQPTLKIGSAGTDVRRLQRTLDAVYPHLHLPVTGIYDAADRKAVNAYRAEHDLRRTGIVTGQVWSLLLKARK